MTMSSLFKMMVWFCVIILLIPIAVATPNGEQPPINREHEGVIGALLAITSYSVVICMPTPGMMVLGTFLAIGSIYLIYDSTNP